MDPITITSLLSLAPSLLKLFTGSDKVEQVAGKVVDVAKIVTGKTDVKEAVTVLQMDPAKAAEFRLQIDSQQMEWEKMYLSDTANARQRDIELVKAGQRNYRANALAMTAIMLVVLCLAIVIWMSNADDFAKATISLILGRALGWVEQLFSFEFGTTRSNKTKDDTINNLTK